ncbi:MAG: hypothetical protein H8D24_00200 [Gammaproteobacteria bacterium]|uniref:Uncharacterized protein n=1 Tax=Candidatus Thiopontia autotrophica TaxID=2841688 RepID=A0A8J6NXZ2_9GAMM|nr:hypothetical protein [Candidatus Thiopontia autotrophica]
MKMPSMLEPDMESMEMVDENRKGNGRLAAILIGLALLVALSSVRFWEQLAATALP